MIKKILPYIFWFYAISLIIGTVIPWSTHEKYGIGMFSFRLDYWLHFFSYMIMTFLYISLKISQLEDGKIGFAFFKSIWILGFALGTEIVQLFIPYRSFNMKDFFADFSGFVTAVLFCLIFRNLLTKVIDLNLVKKRVKSSGFEFKDEL